MGQIISESIHEAFMAQVLEDRVVKFNGQVYPKFGQCVVMSGGGGSGKGYSLNRYIPIDAKHMDVDHFKEMYIKLLNKPNSNVAKSDLRKLANPESSGEELYNMSDPANTTKLHDIIKGRGWKQKERNNFFHKDTTRDPSRLPNVILDVTGSEPNNLTEIAKMAKECGYQTTLAWVVTSRDRAIANALGRDRQLYQHVFHNAHNDIMSELPDYITDEAGQYFDFAWLIFNSSVGLSPKTDEEEKNTSVQLVKQGAGFTINPDDRKRLDDILGQEERNPYNPEVYKDFDEVRPDLDKYKIGKTKAGDNLLKH